MTTNQIQQLIKRDLKTLAKEVTVLLTVTNDETTATRQLVRAWVECTFQYFVVVRYSDGDTGAYPCDGYFGAKLMIVQSI